MKTNFNEIYKEIKDKTNVTTSTSIVAEDLIYDSVTIRSVVSSPCRKYKFIAYNKLSNIFLMEADTLILENVVNRLTSRVVKKLWRLNDKRVRHRLKSWI